MTVSRAEPDRGEAIVRSTHGVSIGTRGAYWRDAVSKVLPTLTVDYRADELLRARLDSRPFADARVTRFIDDTPGGCHVAHTPSCSGLRNAYLLVLQVTGSGSYQHADREVVLDCGDLLLLDMSRRFDLAFPTRHCELAWELPRETLAPLLTAPERVGVRISGHHGFGALLAGSVRTLAQDAGRADPLSHASLRLHLCNLAALAVGATLPLSEARHVTYRVARRQQILAYVEAHLHDENLNADNAARALKMSRRWLHELLSDGSTSFAAWVVRRRIEECRRLLEDQSHDHLSVSEIAFRVGFNDLSTFNRQFRAHYSMSPRDMRRARTSSVKAR